MTATNDTEPTAEYSGRSLDEQLEGAWSSDDPITAYERLCVIVDNAEPTTPKEHQTYMCALLAVATVSIWPSEPGRHTTEQIALAHCQVGLALGLYPLYRDSDKPIYRPALLDALLFALALKSGGRITPRLNPPQRQRVGIFVLENQGDFIPITAGDTAHPIRGVLTISLGSLVDDAISDPDRPKSTSPGVIRKRRESSMERLRRALVIQARQGLAPGPYTNTIDKAVAAFERRAIAYIRSH